MEIAFSIIGAAVGAGTLFTMGYAIASKRNGYIKKEECMNVSSMIKGDISEIKKDISGTREDMGYVKGILETMHGSN